MTDQFAAGAAMRFSTIDPFLVREIIAVWRRGDDQDYSTGFIMRLPSDHPNGEFAYIVLNVESSIKRESVSTQYFPALPTHLYKRAADWINGGPIIAQINEDLGYSKATAKHGPLAGSRSGLVSSSLGWFESIQSA